MIDTGDLSTMRGCGLFIIGIAGGLWLLVFIGVEVARYFYG